MENQASSSMQFLILEQVQFLKVNDDSLLQWELVDVVDAEEEIDGFGSSDSSVSWFESDSSPCDAPIEEIRHLLLHPDVGLQDRHDGVDESEQDSGLENHHHYHYHHDDDDMGGDDNDEDDDGYGLDDELVPWNVSNKFGRQRMRKLGKRAFSKMHGSKKSPYLFVRPGCVRGKHGLGLKHITDS
ncbi:hypothetical protein AAZX31_12G037300 [Glycine max]|uniref:WBb225L1.5 protein n=2 Tax=Glycine subgen. Soja TaxID=1462606 RepID=C6SZH4_SOYBN|nr:uncharacterized protein LOC100804188 [Glycine max]XP_028192150.1 uncharacterized protein LOC114377885 [Glycine soja]ACU14647.1 unknown [Glycine max]ACU24204.1 unknown [Glycine max]KAG4967028.1 hypothetical protein JHK87_032679 [Glycine soja]KAG4979490.1 hypothetical protein JHK85_033448 [Glycine max]KAG4985140.1 hypothetical protein JHK86_032831 [Glycine max]|eukprot:NP_001240125.1 uncharacterized protein LOC100804188 [Glycine max]